MIWTAYCWFVTVVMFVAFVVSLFRGDPLVAVLGAFAMSAFAAHAAADE